MTEVASTLTTHRIGGQLDPAWVLDADETRPWGDVKVVAELTHPTIGPPYLDPSNGAHEHPLSVAHTITRADTEGLWVTAPLKPTTAADPDDALQPTGLGWRVTVHVQRSTEWVCVASYLVALDGDVDYEALGKTITAFGEQVVDINELVDPPVTDPVSSLFSQNVLEVLADNPQPNGEVPVLAAETMSALLAVQLTDTGAVVFEPVAANAGKVLGVTKTAASAGGNVIVATTGVVDATGRGFVTGAVYYVGAGGTLTNVQPTEGLQVVAGYAPDPDTFVVQPSDPIVLI